MAIMPAPVFHGSSNTFEKRQPREIGPEPVRGRTGDLEVQTIEAEGRYFFLGRPRVDDVPFYDDNPHRDHDVVCPRCGRIHQMRTAQDTRYRNDYTYICERCL